MLKIPLGMTEAQVIEELYNSANCFRNFKFGYFDSEDIVQFCVIEGMKILDKYDTERPLGPFLRSHMKRRLINLKRDKYKRKEPCHTCPLKAFLPPDGCSAYKDKEDCSLYAKWIELNTAKQNIMSAISFDSVDDFGEKNMSYDNEFEMNVDMSILYQQVDNLIDQQIRKDYLRFMWGGPLTSSRRQILYKYIKQVVTDNNLV